MDACCNSFGGRISITIDGVRYPPTDADISIDPTNLEIEGSANQDGSAAYTAKPKLYAAEFELRNPCDIIWDEKMRRCKVDVTIVEEDNRRTHLFTGARITGAPKLNLATGAVSGLKIEGARYQKIAS